MGAAPSTSTARKRPYDAEEEEEVDEEGFSEMKDPSHMMLPSPVRTKPSTKMSPEQVVENAVNDARKSFLEGNKLFREARFDEAKLCYEEALRVLREQLSPETGMMMPRVQAAALSNIGILEFSAGRYAEAKDLLSEALALRQQEGHGAFGCAADPMDGLESLAIDLSRNRMFWQAPVTNHRLAAALKSHSNVDGVTADSLNNLAACMEVLGKLDEAKPLYEVRERDRYRDTTIRAHSRIHPLTPPILSRTCLESVTQSNLPAPATVFYLQCVLTCSQAHMLTCM